MARVQKLKKYIFVILIMIAASILILFTFDEVIESIKTSRYQAIEQSKERDFESVWAYIQVLRSNSLIQTSNLAMQIEDQINDKFDITQLEQALDSGDKETQEELYQIFRDNIEGVYLDDAVKNDRNSLIVLEGYDTIIEDKLVEPIAREYNDEFSKETHHFNDYYQKSFNKPLFKSAVNKLRSHTTNQLIALEPFNYLSCKETKGHKMITEMTYEQLKSVYVKEGITGLRNYQFLVPIYITDTGDIFGNDDIVGGIPQDTHKFILIQTFNVYDQLLTIKPDYGDRQYINNINKRYDTILNMLYLCGIIICIVIVIMILYLFSIYNAVYSVNQDLIGVLAGKDRMRSRDT